MAASYDLTKTIKGDAIYETSSGTGKVNNKPTENAWFKETSTFPNYQHGFFKRSGYFDANTTSTGTFYFSNDKGEASKDGSFRPILAF